MHSPSGRENQSSGKGKDTAAVNRVPRGGEETSPRSRRPARRGCSESRAQGSHQNCPTGINSRRSHESVLREEGGHRHGESSPQGRGGDLAEEPSSGQAGMQRVLGSGEPPILSNGDLPQTEPRGNQSGHEGGNHPHRVPRKARQH